MADTYIDQDETQLYGPHAAKHIRSHVVGLVPEFDGALEHVASLVDEATKAVAEQLGAARDAAAGVRETVQGKQTPLDEGKKLLGRFSRHLETHKDGLDRRTFFLKDGTATGVGRTGPRVVAALAVIQRELGKKTCKVDGKAKWLAEVTEATSRLSSALDHAGTAAVDRRALTPEVGAVREAWLTTYVSARDVTRGALRLAGRLDLLKAVFYDLAVPGNAKVEVIPEVPPLAPAPTDGAGVAE